MINRICINGRGGSGKDTFADYLIEHYGFTKIAFADPIYEIAHEYFDMKYKSRDLLQKIGQKFREIRATIWVDYLVKNIHKNPEKLYVVSDVRQRNEYSSLLENGFLPIRINTDLDKRIQRLWKRDGTYPDLKLLENESETGADKCKFYEISNNGSFEDLYKQIDWIMQQDWNEYIKNLQMEFTLGQMY